MAKYTIALDANDVKVVNIVKAITNSKSVGKAVSHIIKDYAQVKSYNKLLNK